MRSQDLHTHSLFDDGNASLEEMVCAAIEKGLSAIGLSGHSPIAEEAWTMRAERLPDYLKETERLKEKYREKIEVFRGIEYDLRSDMDLSPFDYVIGSVHSIGSFDVDDTAEILQEGIERCFGGDRMLAAEQYFSQYAALAACPEINIVGHFDLLTKFDARVGIFAAEEPRYLDAAFDAMACLVRAGKIFEVNSGAMSRGYRTTPYPAAHLLVHLHELGGKVCITSDAHSVDGIAFAFDQSIQLVKACGFTELWQLTKQGFVPTPIFV